MYLIFVNELGPNYRGENIYEFIFSDSIENVWGESWESKPSNGYPLPPDIEHIKKVGILKNDNVSLSVIQKSDYFSMMDSLDDVIAMAWENENELLNFDLVKYKLSLDNCEDIERDVPKNDLDGWDVIVEILKIPDGIFYHNDIPYATP